jgi:8-oxo-dGTP pyrophosphatase MutT (NUDIX family)
MPGPTISRHDGGRIGRDDIRTSVAAILRVGPGYALQLRGSGPTIAYSGHWGFFGGEVEPGETPAEAIRREVREELGLDLPDWRRLWEIPYRSVLDGQPSRSVVFTADATEVWGHHRLREGRAAGVFLPDRLPEPMIPLAVSLLRRYQATVTRRVRGSSAPARRRKRRHE